jgi:hypothetical protein
LETKGNILTMESLFANRIRDYNGLVLQAFKNISILSFADLQRQSALLMSKWSGSRCYVRLAFLRQFKTD